MSLTKKLSITEGIHVGGGSIPVLIAGPCVIEDETAALRLAEKIAQIAKSVGLSYIFKASYD